MSWNSSCQILANEQDRNWRTNVVVTLASAGVYFQLDKMFAFSDGVRMESSPPLVIGGSGVDFGAAAHSCETSSAWGNFGNDLFTRLHWSSFAINVKFNKGRNRFIVFQGSECNRDNRLSLEHSSVVAWIRNLDVVNDGGNFCQYGWLNEPKDIPYATRFNDCFVGYVKYVVAERREITGSDGYIEDAPLFGNLAFRRVMSSLTFGVGVFYRAINGYYDAFVYRNYDGGRTERRLRLEKADQQYRDQLFLRRNDKGMRFFFFSPSGERYEDISSADFDISYDGRRWFHFLGHQCLQDEPRLRAATQPIIR
jgi:hypothetical protein